MLANYYKSFIQFPHKMNLGSVSQTLLWKNCHKIQFFSVKTLIFNLPASLTISMRILDIRIGGFD